MTPTEKTERSPEEITSEKRQRAESLANEIVPKIIEEHRSRGLPFASLDDKDFFVEGFLRGILESSKKREIVWPSEEEVDRSSPTASVEHGYIFKYATKWLRNRVEELNRE